MDGMKATTDLTPAQLKRLSVPKAVRLIREHYGYGPAHAAEFYDFLMHGGDVRPAPTASPVALAKTRRRPRVGRKASVPRGPTRAAAKS
jgi:hypothetical protein